MRKHEHKGEELYFSVKGVSVVSPGSGLRIIVSGVAHSAELGHEEVVAAVIRRRVLLNVGKLHKL